ncbi:hypothetical protein RKD27_009195 [Streptomyces sp. SAI-126]|nr:hypothetical protein [Streptomyces sp. SAI-119]MDH6502380.1 hypothetical protein [Streptomyces sp. SAI-149]
MLPALPLVPSRIFALLAVLSYVASPSVPVPGATFTMLPVCEP